MNNFNSISRQRALALVSYLQRYDYEVILTMSKLDNARVSVYFDSFEELKNLRKFLDVFLVDAYSIEENRFDYLSDGVEHVLMIEFRI